MTSPVHRQVLPNKSGQTESEPQISSAVLPLRTCCFHVHMPPPIEVCVVIRARAHSCGLVWDPRASLRPQQGTLCSLGGKHFVIECRTHKIRIGQICTSQRTNLLSRQDSLSEVCAGEGCGSDGGDQCGAFRIGANGSPLHVRSGVACLHARRCRGDGCLTFRGIKLTGRVRDSQRICQSHLSPSTTPKTPPFPTRPALRLGAGAPCLLCMEYSLVVAAHFRGNELPPSLRVGVHDLN